MSRWMKPAACAFGETAGDVEHEEPRGLGLESFAALECCLERFAGDVLHREVRAAHRRGR